MGRTIGNKVEKIPNFIKKYNGTKITLVISNYSVCYINYFLTLHFAISINIYFVFQDNVFVHYRTQMNTIDLYWYFNVEAFTSMIHLTQEIT